MKKETIESLITQAEEDYGIPLSPEQAARSRAYLGLLLHWNRQISLISVSDMRELVRFHLFESFFAETRLPFPVGSIADIGSGAGFPGIPMHILSPERDTWLIEKSLKKSTFLSAALRETALPGQVLSRPSEEAAIYSGVELATVRALKLSAETLHQLHASGTGLLILEGRKSQLEGEPWKMVLEECCPFSENRMLRVFQPDVSRETFHPRD